jgi:hypothetical protein
MSYSNSYLYSVSNKAQFERPTIPPILKLAQQQQQQQQTTNTSNNNYITTTSNIAKSNIFSHTNNNKTKFNSILSSNSFEAAAEKKFLRQRKLLQEQHQEQFTNINNNKADALLSSADFDPKLILQKSKHLKHKRRSSNYNTSTWSSLAASFPGFYLNPNETNYVKLINSILNSKLKPSAKLTLSPSIEVEIRSKKTTDKATNSTLSVAASEEFYLSTSIRNSEVCGDRLRSNSCLNMHSIDEESSNMIWDQSSSQSFSGVNTRSRTEFDLKINAMLRQSNRPKSPTTSSSSNRKAANRLRSRRNASNANSASSGDVNYRLSSSNKKGLSHKFFVSHQEPLNRFKY